MPSGMENVTTGRAIYRLLTHGEHFIDPAVLTMEYDLLLQIPRIDWKWSSFIKNRTKMDAI